MSLLPNLDDMTDNEKLAVLESIQKSIAQSKELQKKKIGENVDLVVQALKKIESDIRDRFDSVGNSIEKRVLSIKDGRDGVDGKDGRDGKDAKPAKDGLRGERGEAGQAGRDGVDGVDGVSVTNAHIDFDGSLVITLSTGVEINVGEVVSQDVVEKLKIITSGGAGGGGGSGTVTSVATGTGLTGGPITTTGTVALANTAVTAGSYTLANITVDAQGRLTSAASGTAGSGTVTSVAVSGGTTGLTTSGGPITTSGTVTLAGTLAVASGGTGTATPSIVAGTNITVSGTWPNQTVTASGGSGSVTSVAATVPSFLSVSGSPITTSGTLAIGLSGTALPVVNGGTGDTTYTNGQLLIGNTTGNTLTKATLTAGTGVTITNGTGSITIAASGGTGDVVGPASSTDNAITRFDSTTGKLIQNSLVTVADDGAITAPQVGSVIPFYYADQTGFPSAATYHGALAHSHADGAMFFAHGGSWVRIIDNGGPLGTPSSGTLTNATGLPIATGVSGLGTGVATALAVNVGTAGAPVVNGGVLGTPSSGTATNLTGLPLSTGVTGTLPIANGGTGQTTLAGASIATYTGTATLTNKTIDYASNTLTGVVGTTATQTLTNKTIEAGTFTNGYTEEVFTGNSSTAITLDLANGTVQIITLTGNCVYTFPTPVAGKSFTLIHLQDATGSRTVTWPATVDWPSAIAPTLTATASKADKFVFTAISGTSWLGSVAGQNYTV